MADLGRGIRRIARIDARKKTEIEKVEEMMRALTERRAALEAERVAAVEAGVAAALKPTLDKISLLFREVCETRIRQNIDVLDAYRFNEGRERERLAAVAARIFVARSGGDATVSGEEVSTEDESDEDRIEDDVSSAERVVGVGASTNSGSRDTDVFGGLASDGDADRTE